MKVFERLGLITTAAVKDLPKEMLNLLDSYYPGGSKMFIKTMYSYTHKDLNDIKMSDINIKKGTKFKESDFTSILKDRNGFMVIYITPKEEAFKTIFNRNNYKGIIVAPTATGFYSENSRIRHIYVPSKDKNFDASSYRNIAAILESGDFDYKYWIVDLSEAKSTDELREKRYEAQKDTIRRYKDMFNLDKSGYKIDRNKYQKMLKELKQNGNEYIPQLEEITKTLFNKLNERAKAPKEKQGWAYEVEKIMDNLKKTLEYSIEDSYSWSTPKEVQEKIDALKSQVDKWKNLKD